MIVKYGGLNGLPSNLPLKQGAVGPEVKHLQAMLNAAAAKMGTPGRSYSTGVYDVYVRTDVANFQANARWQGVPAGLPTTGEVDSTTWAALEARTGLVYGSPTASPTNEKMEPVTPPMVKLIPSMTTSDPVADPMTGAPTTAVAPKSGIPVGVILVGGGALALLAVMFLRN